MNTKELREFKKSLKLSKFQRDVISGLLLGDGHLETRNGVSYRLKIEHSIKQEAYALWLYQCFKNRVLKEPSIKEKCVFGKKFHHIWFNTISDAKLRFYGKIFYKDGKKVVPRNISKLLTPVSLAVWFMDDGSIKSKFHKTLLLNTQSFSMKDIIELQNSIEKKFGIHSNMRKQKEGIQIEFRGQDAEKFARLIEPNIINSMKYKLDPIGLTKLPKL